MIKFLFITFLIFVLFVFIFGFSVLRMLFGGLFGTPRNKQKQPFQETKKQTQQTRTTSSKNEKKIIDSDEGEYIDYEEIKG